MIVGFFNLRKDEEQAFFIDDRTWTDLDMDFIYEKLERTQTVPGEQYKTKALNGLDSGLPRFL